MSAADSGFSAPRDFRTLIADDAEQRFETAVRLLVELPNDAARTQRLADIKDCGGSDALVQRLHLAVQQELARRRRAELA
jgi:hypothetical protein